jgi:HD-GYP domain-containing protein (c-di-GMP phosphodiesterase class II)
LSSAPSPTLDISSFGPGEAGFRALLNADFATSLDTQLHHELVNAHPLGVPLARRMRQRSVEERSSIYKEKVSTTYSDALQEVQELLTALHHAQRRRNSDVQNIIRRFLETFVTDRNILLNIAGVKHPTGAHLFHHSLNVCLLSLSLAATLGYSESQVIEIGTAALLHDAGMLLVPPAIRDKPSRLSTEEFFEVQKHPIAGLLLLNHISGLPPSTRIVCYQSHERINGKGYPRQRKANHIHPFAKIIHCCDVLEAASSPRNYRQALVPYKGVEMLIKMVGHGFLSAQHVKMLVSSIALFPVGSVVELSDGRIGRVVGANSDSFAKPQITVLTNELGQRLAQQQTYQLDLKESAPDGVQIVKSHRLDYLPDLHIMDGF